MTPISLEEHRRIHDTMRSGNVATAELVRTPGDKPVLTIMPKSYGLPSYLLGLKTVGSATF